MYLYNNTKWVWTGDPSNKEVKKYGNQLGTALQLVVGSAGAMKAIVKFVPKLTKLLDKIKAKKSKCNCFTAGTKVLTNAGEMNIEDIKVGDMVLSKNETTGEIDYKEVVRLFTKISESIYSIQVSDQVIEATGNHPFWVDNKGWVNAEELQVGDLLVQSSGKRLRVEKISFESRAVQVYNFEVADFHTYFVSDLGIWVHNEQCNLLLKAPVNVADHHIMPKFRGNDKYSSFFTKRGINVDNFTVTLSHGKDSHHLKFIHGQGKWNEKWKEWIDDHPNATVNEVYQKAGKMMYEYGLSGIRIHPYGK
jgi:intein/homing endonuclease